MPPDRSGSQIAQKELLLGCLIIPKVHHPVVEEEIQEVEQTRGIMAGVTVTGTEEIGIEIIETGIGIEEIETEETKETEETEETGIKIGTEVMEEVVVIHLEWDHLVTKMQVGYIQ